MQMNKTIFVSGLVICLALEALVTISIYSTRSDLLSGGDVFHNQTDGLPVDIDGKPRILDKGTYVVTRNGPVRLPWYWLYEYGYLSVSLPIVLAIGFVLLYRRSAEPKASVP
jgi:hypothetical protein